MEGIAELPLHDGHVPPHLLRYMKRLARALLLYLVDEFGPDEVVRRLADPFWFQAFNNVIGMDWDSSGSTTVVLYVLKNVANTKSFGELGMAVLGGKGADARRVPQELRELGDNVDVSRLETASRVGARIDSALLQDGYTLYIHGLIVSESGLWTVVQQGMNIEVRMARRYHVHGALPPPLSREPHSGVACNGTSPSLNLVDEPSEQTRRTMVDLVAEGPRRLLRDVALVNRMLKGVTGLERWLGTQVPTPLRALRITRTNPRFYRPVADLRRIERGLRRLAEASPRSFEELALVPGVGPETIRALALVADLIYNARPSHRDPVTHPMDPLVYAYAHGGKDGFPFPVDLKTMERTIAMLEAAIDSSRIELREKRRALKRLADFVKALGLRSELHPV